MSAALSFSRAQYPASFGSESQPAPATNLRASARPQLQTTRSGSTRELCSMVSSQQRELCESSLDLAGDTTSSDPWRPTSAWPRSDAPSRFRTRSALPSRGPALRTHFSDKSQDPSMTPRGIDVSERLQEAFAINADGTSGGGSCHSCPNAIQ